MRVGELPAWPVPAQFAASDAEATLRRPVYTEQPVRERQVLGSIWCQALQVTDRSGWPTPAFGGIRWRPHGIGVMASPFGPRRLPNAVYAARVLPGSRSRPARRRS